jgi:hypothetical protein
MSRACGTCGESRGTYRILVGRPKGRRSLGRPRHRCECNIKMDFQKVGWGHGLDCTGSGYGQGPALVNAVTKLWVP